jgi:hypothetical protein
LNSQINKVLKKLYPKLVPTSMEDPYKLMYLNLVKLEDQEVLEVDYNLSKNFFFLIILLI